MTQDANGATNLKSNVEMEGDKEVDEAQLSVLVLIIKVTLVRRSASILRHQGTRAPKA